jgi:hypothetical protein
MYTVCYLGSRLRIRRSEEKYDQKKLDSVGGRVTHFHSTALMSVSRLDQIHRAFRWERPGVGSWTVLCLSLRETWPGQAPSSLSNADADRARYDAASTRPVDVTELAVACCTGRHIATLLV